MANRLRFRSGQVQLVKVRVDAATVIDAGDLVYLDGDDVKPASALAWDTNLATTQADFQAVFLGVAHQPSQAGETDAVSVDVSRTAVYEFDVPATTYEVGDLLGPDAVSTTLMDQQLEKVSAGNQAVARAVEFKATNSGQLRVCLMSGVF